MTAAVETAEPRPGYVISRMIRGNWQLAGGHGAINRETALDDLEAAFDSGVFTFDCADIYTGVEEIIGAFRTRLVARRGAEAARMLKVHTKLVPDLVQFHWWDYAQPGAVEAMLWLDEIRRAGKMQHLGATNFDTPHTHAILEAGVPLLSMQTQYSLLDTRPENGLLALCEPRDVVLLCYGTVAGGFLSDRWLGAPEPLGPLENRSLTKYKLIIDDFGGWNLFQALLQACRTVADRHDTDIATVASRAVLDRRGVAAVIVGGRHRAHVAANAQIGRLHLTGDDHARIEEVLVNRAGPLGDTYTIERDRTGRHGSIMKYNLNTDASI